MGSYKKKYTICRKKTTASFFGIIQFSYFSISGVEATKINIGSGLFKVQYNATVTTIPNETSN